MRFATLLDVAAPRRPGRPAVDLSHRATRERMLDAVACFVDAQLPVKRAAGLLGVSRSTVYRWSRLALANLDGPDADALRRVSRRSRRKAARALARAEA